MIDNILTLIISFALMAGYMLAVGAAMWVAGLAWMALDRGGSPYRRVKIAGAWK